MAKTPQTVVLNGNGIGEYCNVKHIPRKGETAIPYNRRFEQDSGKGVNCAIVIARLGGDVGYIGKVGKDDGGYLNEQWLNDAGVNTEHFWLDPDVKTSAGLIILAENGENLIYNFDSPGSDITMDEAISHLKQCQGAKYFITGFEVPEDVSLASAKLAKEMGMKVYLNPSPIEHDAVLPKLPFVDVLCINEVEAQIMLGRIDEQGIDYEQAAKDIADKYEVGTVIITLGGNGACAYSPEGTFSIPGYKVTMVDESGAGDAFLAVTAHRLAQGDSLKDAMVYANKYAAHLVTVPGVGAIGKYMKLSEMDAILKSFE